MRTAIQHEGPPTATPEITSAIRTLAVDDHRAFLEALQELIAAAPEFVLVGQASSGEEAIHDVERLSPDLVLMDVVMPGMGGIAAARVIASRHPETVILLISVDEPGWYLGDEDLGGAVVCRRKQDLSPNELTHVWGLLHTGRAEAGSSP